jgi:hypothetical protein
MEEKKKTLFVNLISGPGSGKSTMAHWVFSEIKKMGINCEFSFEYAKNLIYEESINKLNNQIYIFGKQHNQLFHFLEKVDVVVTDSPLIMNPIYDQTKNPILKDLAILEFTKLNNLNFFVERSTAFSLNGRIHGEETSKKIDDECRSIMDDNNIKYDTVISSEEGKNLIVSSIIKKLNGI